MLTNKARAAQDRLELDVKDFGPVAEARMDLRPLTVLVGPSNTGKSYLAILIYALHRFWSELTPESIFLGRRFGSLPPDFFMDASKESVDAIVDFAEWMADRPPKSSSTETSVLPTLITEVLSRYYKKCGGLLDNEIRRCFGIEESAALIRRGARDGASVAISIRNHGNSDAIIQDFWIDPQGSKLRATIPENTTLPADRISENDWDWLVAALAQARRAHGNQRRQQSRDVHMLELLKSLAYAVHFSMAGSLAEGAFYLPADRTGVMHAHSVVVSALIGSAAMGGLRPAARMPMLSGVLADFLEDLIELGGARSRSRRKLGDGIETTILKGSIGVENSEAAGYPHFTYSPEGWERSLPLANASSMVSELAPVVLYLRHKVGRGNMLIIEEPESHLHPAMQVQFTREIAALVQAGVRVVLTTHSEWVLEELANIVGRSRLPEPGRNALPACDVGVWLFEPKEHPGGSTVREVLLDESGLYSPGFGDVAAALHNDWADISSQIEEGA